MKTKLYFLLSILILGTVLTACGPSTSSAQSQPPQRTVSVNGVGLVSLTPDIAYIYIGIHTDDVDLATAVSKNNTQAQALVDALKNAGVEGEDIQTSNFSIYTNANSGFDKMTDQGIPNGTFYSVDNTVYVTVRDLTHLGTFLNTAVSSGANSINSLQFDVADKTAAMLQARQKAMVNASNLANELAQTAGLKLGEIQTITYADYSPSPYYGYGMGGGASAPNASVPIQPGQIQVSVTVSVTYEIK